ncbi:hypothetical protein P3L10_028622 [Capsicum annuum]
MKAALGNCAGAYALLKLDFDNMREAFQSGRPIGQQGESARVAVSKCDNDFNEKKLTSSLAEDNNNLLDFIQIIVGNVV